jgi:hypothetical protein
VINAGSQGRNLGLGEGFDVCTEFVLFKTLRRCATAAKLSDVQRNTSPTLLRSQR